MDLDAASRELRDAWKLAERLHLHLRAGECTVIIQRAQAEVPPASVHVREFTRLLADADSRGITGELLDLFRENLHEWRSLGETRLAEFELAMENLDDLNRQRDTVATRVAKLQEQLPPEELKKLSDQAQLELKALRADFERKQERRAQYYPDGAPVGGDWSAP